MWTSLPTCPVDFESIKNLGFLYSTTIMQHEFRWGIVVGTGFFIVASLAEYTIYQMHGCDAVVVDWSLLIQVS
jgi:hypothetical protein